MKAEDLLKEINGILVINLLDYAYSFHDKYHQCFKEPELGIYYVNQIDPIITGNQKVYTRASIKTNEPLQTLDNVTTDIIDADGRIIIPAYIMERKNKYLFSEPNLPSRAIKLTKIIIEEYVDSLLPYTEPCDFEVRVAEHLVEEGLPLYKDGYFEAICSRVISVVSQFIGLDTWNFYHFELKNTDLMITKSCDFRIYDWTLIQEERREIARKKAEDALNS